MNQSERDKKLNKTHDVVIRLETEIKQWQKDRNILFEGYNQTQKNSVYIKIGSALLAFLSDLLSWRTFIK